MVASFLFLDSSTAIPLMGTVWNEEKEMSDLYVALRDRIYSFLYKYTKNEDTAMDLLQDTFLSFFKSYGKNPISREDAIPLLYRIARNRSINHSKKFSSHKEVSDLGMEFHPDHRSFESRVIGQDMEERLQSCMDELSAEEKEALTLRFMEELNLNQIAGVLGVSISTASRLVVRATTKMIHLAKNKGIEWG